MHERGVHTQRLKRIIDIDEADVAAVEAGTAITSRWLTGHTAPISDGTQLISPDEIAAELKKLTDFRAGVLERRKGKKR